MSWQPRGSSQIAPDLFWRQEPGVDLNVRSEGDWQHGLRLYAAYDRVAGAKDIMETVRTAVKLPESTGKVALQGYCLGALMAFITRPLAMRSTPPLPIMVAKRKNTSAKSAACAPPC